jgi:hypothetical protein
MSNVVSKLEKFCASTDQGRSSNYPAAESKRGV